MTWEETIRFIRTQPEFHLLVEQSYLDENLRLNAERFRSSAEFSETLLLIREFAGGARSILDIGAGNGISSVALAQEGYDVTAVEPDPSSTVGSGAIETLKHQLDLQRLQVVNSYGEKLPFENSSFDVVYMRQAMHHASALQGFISEAARVLRQGGLLMTIRDHVVYGKRDKEIFLETHPLQKFYGGENAFSEREYTSAMEHSGLKVVKRIPYYSSVINYYPVAEKDAKNAARLLREKFKLQMQKKFGSWIVNSPFLQTLELISQIRNGKWMDDKRVPGRMYSFLAIKN